MLAKGSNIKPKQKLQTPQTPNFQILNNLASILVSSSFL